LMGIMQNVFHSNKSYPLRAIFKHSSSGARNISALFNVGA
jgi:hypothetical protein